MSFSWFPLSYVPQPPSPGLVTVSSQQPINSRTRCALSWLTAPQPCSLVPLLLVSLLDQVLTSSISNAADHAILFPGSPVSSSHAHIPSSRIGVPSLTTPQCTSFTLQDPAPTSRGRSEVASSRKSSLTPSFPLDCTLWDTIIYFFLVCFVWGAGVDFDRRKSFLPPKATTDHLEQFRTLTFF